MIKKDIAKLAEECPRGPLKLSLEIRAGKHNTDLPDRYVFSEEEIGMIVSALIHLS